MSRPTVTTTTTRHWLREDGLLQSEALNGAGQSLADARGNVAAYATLGRGRRRPLLVDLRQAGGTVDRDARAYYAGPDLAAVVSAAAVLVGSPVGRVIGAFYLNLVRPAAPIRVFTDEAEALAWLETYRSAEDAPEPLEALAPAASPTSAAD